METVPQTQAQSIGVQSPSWSTFSVQHGDSKNTYTVDHTESTASTSHSSNVKKPVSTNAANNYEANNMDANSERVSNPDVGNIDYTEPESTTLPSASKPPPPPALPPKGIKYDPRKYSNWRNMPKRPNGSPIRTNEEVETPNHKNYHNHRLAPEQPPQKLVSPKSEEIVRR